MTSFKPKYKIISEKIIDLINNLTYQEDDELPTEKEFMEKFSVSRSTIRKALNILEQEDYIYRIKGSGTFIKNKEYKKTSIKIGVITTYISEYIFPSIIRGIENVLKKNNVSLVLASTNNDYINEKKCIDKMLKDGVDGLIIEPARSNTLNPNLEEYLNFKLNEMPYILINAPLDLIESSCVIFNDFKAAYDLTEYLIKLNHKNIGLIIKYDDYQGKQRLKGYLKALENYGINKTFIYSYETGKEKDVSKEFMCKFKDNNITSLLAYNDEVASEIYKLSIKNEIKIPEDLSLVSVDNSSISESLDITSCNHPKSRLGSKSAKILLNKIYRQDSSITKYVFNGRIIKRKSVIDLKEKGITG